MSNVKSIKKTDGDKTLPKRNEDVTVIFDEYVEDGENPWNFREITFPNLIGMSIGQHWVTITGEDNKSYVYPASRIREIQQVYKD